MTENKSKVYWVGYYYSEEHIWEVNFSTNASFLFALVEWLKV